MAIITQEELIGIMPEATRLLAMDDDGDSLDDGGVFAGIATDAERWIGGYLEQAGITLPDPVPSRLKQAALRYAQYTLFERRGVAVRAKEIYDQWLAPAMKWLDRIAQGKEALTPSTDTTEPAEAIVEDARSYSAEGRLMA